MTSLRNDDEWHSYPRLEFSSTEQCECGIGSKTLRTAALFLPTNQLNVAHQSGIAAHTVVS